MKKRAAARLILPLGLAAVACSDPPTAPDPDPSTEAPALTAAVIAMLADGAVPFSEARVADLNAAIEDIQARLLPALGDDVATVQLRSGIVQLEAKLAAGDARAVVNGAA